MADKSGLDESSPYNLLAYWLIEESNAN